ncbi:MAG: S8 family serine peptidase [Candidatus Marinimicrobia bacterium]|nr:S8 family serine peptidase [Candidatus Neomarinimicrobiota bacterium]
MKHYSLLLVFSIFISNLDADYKTDTFLFCLNPNQSPLQITRNDGDIRTSNADLDNILNLNNVIKIEPWLRVTTPKEHSSDIYLNRIYKVFLPDSKSDIRDQLRNEISTLSFIHSTEKEPIHRPVFTPNDPYYNQQWFLPQIHADDAWNLWDISDGELPGNKNVLLASVDTGVDWDHVDLVDNIWNNPGEDANGNGVTILYQNGNWIYDPGDLNGVDDDDNGYVDDLIGWDIAGYSGLQDNNPSPPSGVSNTGTWAHGTHVAGLLSAPANNSIGIASVGFNCSIMSVKVSTGEQSYPYITHGYEGILYAARAGFHNDNFTIINNSWGGIGYNQYEQAIIDVAYDDYNAIIVAAAGNGDDFGLGTDEFAHYPSSYNHVISVCAMGSGDNWNHWATYHESVDLASPGENIRSTRINNGYTSWSGSSMASPIAAGTIGLLRSYKMGWNNEMLETMILATADPIIYDVNPESYLQEKLGRGRVEALKAVNTSLFPKFELVGTDFYNPNNPGDAIMPGDDLEVMVILLNNEDWGIATNVSTVLSSESNQINITNPNISLEDAWPGIPILNDSNPFLIEISSSIVPGVYNLTLELNSNEDDYVHFQTELTFTLQVEEGNQIMPGDLNFDDVVNILDIIALANLILEGNPSSEELAIADLNGDGTLNILDVIAIVNIILDN